VRRKLAYFLANVGVAGILVVLVLYFQLWSCLYILEFVQVPVGFACNACVVLNL
jgi:hypothetical protein